MKSQTELRQASHFLLRKYSKTRLIFKNDKDYICEKMRETVGLLAINHIVNVRIIITAVIANGDECDWENLLLSRCGSKYLI